jgi:hypothetical protein
MPRTQRLRLILGDQLNDRHSWFQKKQDNVTYVLIEVRQETDYVKHHIQKVASFFAAMRAFSRGLIKRGHRVIYLRLDDPSNDQNFETNLKKLIRKEKFAHFEYLLPDELWLDERISTKRYLPTCERPLNKRKKTPRCSILMMGPLSILPQWRTPWAERGALPLRTPLPVMKPLRKLSKWPWSREGHHSFLFGD